MNKKRCSVRKALRGLDIYAKPISLTYKGKEKFSSSLGGTLSLIVLFALMALFFYSLNVMINREQTQIKKNSLVSISNSFTPPEVISSKNITFAFMLSNYYGEGSYDDPYYGKLTLKQKRVVIKNIQQDGSINRDYYSVEIPFSKCEIGRNFFYDNEEEVNMYGIDQYYCPDWQNLTIQGNWYSPEFQVIELEFHRCFEATCASDSEFEEWFGQLTMQEIFISSYFDIEDYEQPIHYFLDDSYVSLQYGRSIIYQTFIQRNLLYLNDKFFNLFMSHEEDYFYTRSHNEYFTADDTKGPGVGVYFSQNLKLAKEYDRYERSVYTITGVLQDVGGFYNSLFFIGLVLSIKFQRTIFFSTLFSKLYQVELQQNEVQSHNMMSQNNDSEMNRPQKQIQKTSTLKENLNAIINENKFKSKAFPKLMSEYILRRVRISFSSGNIIGYTLSQLLCPCFKKDQSKERASSLLDRRQLFQQGHDRVLRDLDCINLLNQIRHFNQISNLLFSQQQQFLMKYSARSLINSTTNDQQDYDMIPKYSQTQKYENKRIRSEQDIKMRFKQLSKQQLSEIDKKLLLQIIQVQQTSRKDSIVNTQPRANLENQTETLKGSDHFIIQDNLINSYTKKANLVEKKSPTKERQRSKDKGKKFLDNEKAKVKRIKSKKLTNDIQDPPLTQKESSAQTLRNPLQDSQRVELLEISEDFKDFKIKKQPKKNKKSKTIQNDKVDSI